MVDIIELIKAFGKMVCSLKLLKFEVYFQYNLIFAHNDIGYVRNTSPYIFDISVGSKYVDWLSKWMKSNAFWFKFTKICSQMPI